MYTTIRFSRLLAVAGLLAFSFVAGFAQERTIVGKVVEVQDGDTITVQDEQQKQHIVRLAGIDAPEINQDHGKKARKYLSDLVLDKAVSVSTSKMDRTGEYVGKVLVYGRDVGLEMIMAGLAWHYKQYANEQGDRDRQLFEGAELHARKSRFNLWSSSRPTPPWEFRKEPSELPNVELRTLSAPANTTSSETKSNTAATQLTTDRPAATQPTGEIRTETGEILGNRNSKIYHWPGCPGYDKVAEKNRVMFKSRAEAESAGFRAAKNCN